MNAEVFVPAPSESRLTLESGLASYSTGARGAISWPVRTAHPTAVSTRTRERHAQLSPWCTSIWKRLFDLACVVPALILLSPVFTVLAIAVRLTSPGPVIFRQKRAGQHRRLFTIYKFRTMVEDSEAMGPGHTAKGDPRITSIGHFLRRFKLDELPQLFNVLRGEMSLVGPRPKLPNHELTPLTCRPGATGAATLAFRNEQYLLCNVPAQQLETYYQEQIMPCKLRLDTEYMQVATFTSDVHVLIATILGRGGCLTYEDLSQSKP